MNPLVASLVGSWVLESEKMAKEFMWTFRYMSELLSLPHSCTLKLTGVCPKCEENWELEYLFEEDLELTRGALLGNFLSTCRAAVEHASSPQAAGDTLVYIVPVRPVSRYVPKPADSWVVAHS